MSQVMVTRSEDRGRRRQVWVFWVNSEHQLLLDVYRREDRTGTRRSWVCKAVYVRLHPENSTLADPPLPADVRDEALARLRERLTARRG